MRQLGDLLWIKHRDAWLHEALRDPEPLNLLAEAVEANFAGDHSTALVRAADAARSYRRAGNVACALRSETERAYALQRLALAAECLSAAEEALRRTGTRPYPSIRIQLELEVGVCRNLQGRVGAALAASERALRRARESGYDSLELRAASFTASYQAHLGYRHALWKDTLSALDTWRRGPARGLRGQNLLLNLSDAAEEAGQAYSVYVIRKEAADALADEPNQRLIALSRSQLAAAALRAGEREDAARQSAVADRLFDGMPANADIFKYRAEAWLTETDALADEPALRALNALRLKAPRMPTALLEVRYRQALGGVYQRLERWHEAEREFAGAAEESEKRLDQLRSPDQKMSILAAARGCYRGLVSARIIAHSDWAGAFEAWERSHGAGNSGASGPALNEETFLVYVVLPAGVAAFVAENGKLHGRWLAPANAERRRAVRAFVRECADAGSSEASWKASARELYDWLVAPLEPWLTEGRTLVVEADGLLGDVPFAALMNGSGQFLGDRFALAATDSVALYGERARRGPAAIRAGASAVVFSDPALRGELGRLYPPLQGPDTDVAEVARLFAARIYRRKKATLGVLEAVGPGTALFHFAGHGVNNASSGGLLLSPEIEGDAEVLDAAKVRKQDWRRCELVTLAACSTAGAAPETEADAGTLARAFLDAGARRVIASRWQVDSQATGVLMQAFYRALGRGAAPSEALREAARAMRAEHSHPYYWAAFDLLGYR